MYCTDFDFLMEFKQSFFVLILCKVDNDDYVRRVLKTEDSKPPPAAKKESTSKESSKSQSKVSWTFS
jgi:hypothetical protein